MRREKAEQYRITAAEGLSLCSGFAQQRSCQALRMFGLFVLVRVVQAKLAAVISAMAQRVPDSSRHQTYGYMFGGKWCAQMLLD